MLTLQEELTRDLDRIKSAKQDLEQNMTTLQKRLEQATRAPQEDARRIMEQYGLSGQCLGNIGRLLLGGKLSQWVEQGLRWHDRLEPVLNRLAERKKGVEVVKPVRGKGMDVRFREYAPLPDFLIRTAGVTVSVPAGEIAGQVRNITPDQHVLGSPLTFAFAGDNLTGLRSVKLDGAINRVDPAKPVDAAALHVRGYRLEQLVISEGGMVPLTLKQGTGDVDVRAELRGEAIAGAFSANLQGVHLATDGKTDNAVAAAVAGALSDVRSLQIKADVSGTRAAPDITLTSNLDQVLKKVVGRQIQAQTARVESQLRAAIEAKVGAPLAELKSSVGGLDEISKELTSRLSLGAEATKSKGSLGGFKLPF